MLVLLPLASVLVPGRSMLADHDDPECSRWRRAFVGMPRATLIIHPSAGQRIRIRAKVAGAAEARQAGFQCATREEIGTTVVVFDFHSDGRGEFHMRNVSNAYRYAIEARAGFFKERGISSADEMVLLESR